MKNSRALSPVDKKAKQSSSLLAFALILTTMLLFCRVLIFRGEAESSSPWFLLAGAVAKLAAFLLPYGLVFAVGTKYSLFPPAATRTVSRIQCMKSGVAAVSLVVLLQILYCAAFPSVVSTLPIQKDASGFLYAAFFFSSVLVPAVAEELLFRKAILSGLAAHRRLLALLMSSLIFGLMHFSPSAFPMAFFCGLVLGGAYLMTGSILCSIAVHFSCNFLTFVTALVRSLAPDAFDGWRKAVFAVCALIVVCSFRQMRAAFLEILSDQDSDAIPASDFWTPEMGFFVAAVTAIQWIEG